jgi:cytochrome c peroxidase
VAAASKKTTPETFRSLYKRPTSIPYPKDNEYSKHKEHLGKVLFFDPRLSASNWISCATCHNPGLSWGDGLPRGIGHGMGVLGRRTQTLLNLAWGDLYFWDGRAESLEIQALGPIESPGEMALPHDKLIKKLTEISEYQELFKKAFPGSKEITLENIGKSIATFERTIVSGIAPFDEWVSGKTNAISESAKRGFVLFNEKAKCATCHSGWRFTDDAFHDIGIADDDEGRGKLIPDIPVLRHAFKTPTLRNVNSRSPYMHGGSLSTLVEVVELYNRGGDVKRDSLAEQLVPLGLSAQEKADLVSFLNSLTSVDKPITIPVLPK